MIGLNNYSDDRSWSDRFIPLIKQTIGMHLLAVSTFEQDTKEAADLVVLTASPLKIACRVRKHQYLSKYGNEFTIRKSRPNGSKTEYEKIIDGFGNWMFYAFSNPSDDGSGFSKWWIFSLYAFRVHLIRSAIGASSVKHGEGINPDGTTFEWFNIDSFVGHPKLIIAELCTPKSSQ